MTASEGDRCLFKTYVAAPVVALGRSRTVTEVRCELRHWPAGVAQFSIRLSCVFENGWPSCRCLATAKDDIDIERIKLNAAAASPSPFGSDEGRSRPEEWVEDDVATARHVE